METSNTYNIYSYSKLGNKYDKVFINNNDEEYHNKLRNMYRKVNCTDCNSQYASWATLKRGVFICINCAQILRADCENKIKSCMGTYLWHPDELKYMKKHYKKGNIKIK